MKRAPRTLVSVAQGLLMLALLTSICNAGQPPKELKVRQNDGRIEKWNVAFSDKPMCMAGDSGAKWGVTSCNAHTITLWTGLGREEMADIFMHELMHVVTNCEDREEDLHDAIYEIAPGMRRILSDNPKWARFVMAAPISTPLVRYGTGPIDRSCAKSETSPGKAAEQ